MAVQSEVFLPDPDRSAPRLAGDVHIEPGTGTDDDIGVQGLSDSGRSGCP